MQTNNQYFVITYNKTQEATVEHENKKIEETSTNSIKKINRQTDKQRQRYLRTQTKKSNDTEDHRNKNTTEQNRQNCLATLEKRDSESTKIANII